MSRDNYIYALVDPRTDEVFYVGRTDKPTARLISHLNRARSRPPGPDAPELEPKEAWIRSINGDPEMRVLQRISGDYVAHAELRWLTAGFDAGWPLTNLNDACQRPLRPLSGDRTPAVADLFRLPAGLMGPPEFVALRPPPFFFDSQSARDILEQYYLAA